MTRIKSLSRNLIFWIIFALLSLCGLSFAYKFFPSAFPILDIQLTMDRQQALQKAKALSTKNKWGPEGFYQAASFKADSKVNNFIELEGGGPAALRAIINENYYSPYFWVVRHFKEYDPLETLIYFTPEGKPYGFTQKIPDFLPGPALTVDQARTIAQQKAIEDWNVEFADYKNVEESQKILSSGRIEHTFVYERSDKKVGEAPYRLKIVVNGDDVTELKLSLKVPEAFTRRYQEMRSANTTIALIATIIMILLYVFGGCLLGLFFLVKDHWLLWKKAFIWGLIIASLQAANALNELPLVWLHYDTVLSLWQFLSKLLVSISIQFFGMATLGTVLFMVAEGLTRKAFPHHIQLWKLWSPGVANSWQLLGRTLTGYLILGFDFAFSIGFYYIAFNYFGWWSPSEALYNPDAVATYIPWLNALVSSLSAGFIEEMLFRAIPLSSAALLGDRYGKRSWWIAAAFILQAVIFGAAHANYPAQPAFARLVELIIPSFVFGFLYLIYGLLPAIISHFIFDVVWFSLPIFVSHAPGIWVDKLMVIVMSLIPLFIILLYRIKQGRWYELPASFYNYAWQRPSQPLHSEVNEHEDYRPKITMSMKYLSCSILFACVGLISWFMTTKFSYDTGSLPLARSQVIDFIKKHYPIQSWHLLSAVEDPLEKTAKNQHVFIWRQLGSKNYYDLLGNYLKAPSWKVRLAHFDGDIVDRAQEYQLYVAANAVKQPYLVRAHHKLPESLQAADLNYQEARQKALTLIEESYKLQAQQLKEISAVPIQQPNRLDWTFTFQDTTQVIGDGQARIVVEIDGDEIVDHYSTIFIPETWQREYKAQESFFNLATIIRLSMLFLLIALGTLLILSKKWRFIRLNKKIFITISILLLFKYLVQTVNTWPLVSIYFSTSEPYIFQALSIIGIVIVIMLFKSGMYGFLAGLLSNVRLKSAQMAHSFSIQAGLAIAYGAIGAGVYAAIIRLIKSPMPQGADFFPLSAYSPMISFLLSTISSYIETTLLILFIVIFADYLSDGWKKNKIITGLMLILFTGSLIDISSLGSLWMTGLLSCAGGIIALLFYCYGVRFSKPSIPLMVAAFLSLNRAKILMVNPYPQAFSGAVLALLFMMVFGLYWAYLLYTNDNERVSL